MKRLITLACVVALAGCAEAEAPEVEEAVVEEVAVPAPVGPGTYEVTYADGTIGTMVSAEDGTFTTSIDGEVAGSGTYTDTDGQVCFDSDGDEEGAQCWTNSPAADDGSFTSVSDEGETVSVVPVVAETDG